MLTHRQINKIIFFSFVFFYFLPYGVESLFISDSSGPQLLLTSKECAPALSKDSEVKLIFNVIRQHVNFSTKLILRLSLPYLWKKETLFGCEEKLFTVIFTVSSERIKKGTNKCRNRYEGDLSEGRKLSMQKPFFFYTTPSSNFYTHDSDPLGGSSFTEVLGLKIKGKAKDHPIQQPSRQRSHFFNFYRVRRPFFFSFCTFRLYRFFFIDFFR